MGSQVGSSSATEKKTLKWIPRGEKLQKIRNQTLEEKQVPGSVGKSRYDPLTEKAAAKSKNTNQVVGVDGRDL